MLSTLFVAGVVLVLIFGAIVLFLSSDILTKKAPQGLTNFISGLTDVVAKATQRCGGYQDKDSCESDTLCKWCETLDVNQNTILFCTTKKSAAELKCRP